MEIHALRLSLTEGDLTALMNKELARHEMVKNVRLRVRPEGVHVTGNLHAVFDFAFESTWSLGVRAGLFTSQLTGLKALGMSAGILKGMLMRFIADAARKVEGVQIQGDTVLVDVDRLMSREGLTGRINLQSVVTTEGLIQIEAGHYTARGRD